MPASPFCWAEGVREPPRHGAVGLGHSPGRSGACGNLEGQSPTWPRGMEGIRWKLSGAVLGWEEPENHRHGGSEALGTNPQLSLPPGWVKNRERSRK